MASILDELYYGNLHPCEDIQVDTAEYRALTREQTRRYEELCQQLEELDPQLRRSLDRFLDGIGGPEALREAAVFRWGFRLGAAVALDLLTGEPLTRP